MNSNLFLKTAGSWNAKKLLLLALLQHINTETTKGAGASEEEEKCTRPPH